MPPFKDEHVLIIAPGSQTTLAQLGLPETFTPPRWRFPSRMFPGAKTGEWEPIKVQTRTVSKTVTVAKTSTENNEGANKTHDQTPKLVDVDMKDPADQVDTAPAASTSDGDLKSEEINVVSQTEPLVEDETITTTEETFEDDPMSLEEAVYPLKGGRIENWPCFFALLSHVYKFISPPFHMPVLVISQPCWTARDKEWITQYFFENWKIPALCVMDSALAAVYAYGIQSATIIDVGLDKCDVTAVSEFIISEIGRAVSLPDCGGNAMTKRLQEVLSKRDGKEASWELADQLKRSAICEILPPGMALRNGQPNNQNLIPPNPAAAASTGAVASGPNAKDIDGQKPGLVPRGPGLGTDVGEEQEDDNEGVLDVAAIVARDNAAELLAKREKEKAERAAAKKNSAAQDLRTQRMKNSARETASFLFEEYLPFDDTDPGRNRKRRREVEIGPERFMAHTAPAGETDGVLEKIAAAVHSTIMSVPDVAARAALWDNLIILGNGSRVRGFPGALLATLSSLYTLSPSNTTIFTSELPSNFTTPVGTNGTNTPVPGQASQSMHHPGHGVNPLLVAATKNMMQPGGTPQQLAVPGQTGLSTPMSGLDPAFHQSYRGFSQTPTSLKTVKSPEYFPDWKDPSVSGMEDAVFLGAQVAAKLMFIVDAGVSKGFLTRTDYNDLGPEGIHTVAM